MKSWVAIIAAGAAALSASAPATAVQDEQRTIPADLTVTEAMIPYLYRYAACAFDPAIADVSVRLEKCGEIRARIVEEAKPVLPKWHRGKEPTRKRQFDRALRQIDTEARILDNHYGPVPASVVGYMHCLGTTVSKSEAFIKVRSINYVGVDRDCRAKAPVSLEDSTDLERRLYQRVRRTGRVNFVPLAVMVAYEFPRGLLADDYY